MGLVVLVVRNSFPGVGGVDWTPDILGHALVCPGPCSKEKRAFAYTPSRLLRGMLLPTNEQILTNSTPHWRLIFKGP